MQPVNRVRFGTVWQDEVFDGETAHAHMRRAFAAAAAARPAELRESSYELAGRTVQVRVLGRDLHAHIVRPFSHLRIEGGAADPALTIELWDDGIAGPPCARGPIGRDQGWHETTLQSGDRFIAQQLPHTLSCLDRHTGHLVGAIAWNDDVFIYERAKPLARLLLAWHNDRQVQIIHTALVARHGTGVLLAGKSGSGKSTSALTCVMAGFEYLSEDYVGLERRDDGSFVGHSVYNSAFVRTSHLDRLAGLGGHAIHGRPPHEEKSALILSQVFPERLARSVPIAALVFPQVGDAPDAQIHRISKSAALLSLAPSSLLQIPNRGLGASGLDRLAQLVDRLPCFGMTVGSNLASIPERLDALIAGVRA